MKSLAAESGDNIMQYHKDKLKLHTDAFKQSLDNEKKHSNLYRAAKKEGNQAAAEFHDSEAEKHLKAAEEHSAQADKHRRIINNGNKAGGKVLAAVGTRGVLEFKADHHRSMNNYHRLQAIHHEKEYAVSKKPSDKYASINHHSSADYHMKQGEKVHNKIMDHIGRNQAR
jgi:hypothetical protein